MVMGVLGTGAAYILNYQIIAADGPTAASTVVYLLPAVAVVLGTTVLDEPLTALRILGTAVILTSVALTRRRCAES